MFYPHINHQKPYSMSIYFRLALAWRSADPSAKDIYILDFFRERRAGRGGSKEICEHGKAIYHAFKLW